MIVYNCNVVCVSVLPNKANSPLRIDTYAVLAFPISLQFFEVIVWWRFQIC